MGVTAIVCPLPVGLLRVCMAAPQLDLAGKKQAFRAQAEASLSPQ